MSREATHRFDREWGRIVQIVSAERLREILDAGRDSYERPKDFGPDDEWDVAGVDSADEDQNVEES